MQGIRTKMEHLFLLDRETGKPLFRVTEKPVPQNGVEGEKLSPTQPFPEAPRPLVPQTLSPADAWGTTEEDRAWCREHMATLRTGPIFTPPSLEGTLVFPGTLGGMNWGGVAFDPERQLIITNTNRLPFMVRLVPKHGKESDGPPAPKLPMVFPQAGTPYAAEFMPFVNPRGIPCNPPPWGTLVAVSATDGTVKWEVPLGVLPELREVAGAEKWGSPSLGGAITTAGGLVFVAASRDASIRAFDIETGKVLWRADLPGASKATPMTFMTEQGKQMVVIAAGGWESPRHDELVAFELPSSKP